MTAYKIPEMSFKRRLKLNDDRLSDFLNENEILDQ